jgi:hypothetical protein
MTILVRFTVTGMDRAKYDEVLRRLKAAGAGAPPGRRYHVSYGSPESLQVIDVYDSPESFEVFGRTLLPILAEMRIDPGRPEVVPVNNVIVG